MLNVSVPIKDNHSTGWLCLSDLRKAEFIILLPDGGEHIITDYKPGAGCNTSTGEGVQRMFADVLGFMSACAEAYRYAMSKLSSEKALEECLADTDNGTLFPLKVAEFCYQMSDEIQMLCLQIEEAEEPLVSIQQWYSMVTEKVGRDTVAASLAQVVSLNRVCDRYGKRPVKLSLTSKYKDRELVPDTLFADFEFILIGIEPDGYSHS